MTDLKALGTRNEIQGLPDLNTLRCCSAHCSEHLELGSRENLSRSMLHCWEMMRGCSGCWCLCMKRSSLKTAAMNTSTQCSHQAAFIQVFFVQHFAFISLQTSFTRHQLTGTNTVLQLLMGTRAFLEHIFQRSLIQKESSLCTPT